MRRITLVSLTFVYSSFACTESVSIPPGVSVRDSAGIQIVHSSQSVWESTGRGWVVSPDPVLEIGVLEGPDEYLFSSLVDVQLGRGNQVWIADRGINSIRIFEADGTHLRSTGGEGEGPGEFQALEGFLRVPDGLIGYQGAHGPASLFDLSGSFQRTISFDARPEVRAPFVVGTVEEETGVWAVISHYPQGQQGRTGLYEDQMPVYADLLEADSVRDFGLFTASRFVGVPGRRGTPHWQEYGPFFTMAVSATHLFLSWPVEYSISQIDTGGQVVRILRRDWDPSPVAEDDRQKFVASQLTFPEGRQPPPPILDFRRQLVDAMVYPEHHPPLDRLLADSEGNLWVRQHEPHRRFVSAQSPRVPAERTVWDVFDRSGRWYGSISLPERFLATCITNDRIAGIFLGEFDVGYVRVYAIEKPGGE